MTEIVHSDDVLHRAQELESYVNLSEETLKSLRIMKQEADNIIKSLAQRKDELSRHEQDLVEYLKKLQLVSQKADALLTPITDQKLELESLTKKLDEGIAGIEGVVQQKVEPLVQTLDTKLKGLEERLGTTNETLQNSLEVKAAEFHQKQDELAKELSQRIDGCEKQAGVQKAALEEEGRTVEHEAKDISGLRKSLQELKEMLDKQKEEFKSVAEKQGEELKGLLEKQKGELTGSLSELNEKHIKNLEKENAQIKSALNAIIAKLGNVKFKKLLGL